MAVRPIYKLLVPFFSKCKLLGCETGNAGSIFAPTGKKLSKKSVPIERQRFPVAQGEHLNAAMPEAGFQGCELTSAPLAHTEAFQITSAPLPRLEDLGPLVQSPAIGPPAHILPRW